MAGISNYLYLNYFLYVIRQKKEETSVLKSDKIFWCHVLMLRCHTFSGSNRQSWKKGTANRSLSHISRSIHYTTLHIYRLLWLLYLGLRSYGNQHLFSMRFLLRIHEAVYVWIITCNIRRTDPHHIFLHARYEKSH